MTDDDMRMLCEHANWEFTSLLCVDIYKPEIMARKIGNRWEITDAACWQLRQDDLAHGDTLNMSWHNSRWHVWGEVYVMRNGQKHYIEDTATVEDSHLARAFLVTIIAQLKAQQHYLENPPEEQKDQGLMVATSP